MSPRSTRTYSEPEKAQAVGTALTIGDVKASALLGIPRRTIGAWRLRPEFQQLREAAATEVASEMWRGVQIGVRSVIDGFTDPESTLRDRALAFGILFDKHALISGGVTSRSESANYSITDSIEAEGLSDDEARALVASLRREMELRSEGPLTPDEVAELATYLEAKGAPDVG